MSSSPHEMNGYVDLVPTHKYRQCACSHNCTQAYNCTQLALVEAKDAIERETAWQEPRCTSNSITLVAEHECKIVSVASATLRCRTIPKHLARCRWTHLDICPKQEGGEKKICSERKREGFLYTLFSSRFTLIINKILRDQLPGNFGVIRVHTASQNGRVRSRPRDTTHRRISRSP
jgi:hypothetical protein